MISATLYGTEHGCRWHSLLKRFGNWHTIYTRMRRWTQAGVLDKMFEALYREQVVRIKIEAVSLDSTSIKVHPDGTGALKKRSAGDWQVPRRMGHQESYSCRGCSNGRNVQPVARPGSPRPRGQKVAWQFGLSKPPGSFAHGSRP